MFSERTRTAVAKEAGVSGRKLQTAQEIKKAAPHLVPAIRAGEMTLAEARREVRKTDLVKKLNGIEQTKATVCIVLSYILRVGNELVNTIDILLDRLPSHPHFFGYVFGSPVAGVAPFLDNSFL